MAPICTESNLTHAFIEAEGKDEPEVDDGWGLIMGAAEEESDDDDEEHDHNQDVKGKGKCPEQVRKSQIKLTTNGRGWMPHPSRTVPFSSPEVENNVENEVENKAETEAEKKKQKEIDNECAIADTDDEDDDVDDDSSDGFGTDSDDDSYVKHPFGIPIPYPKGAPVRHREPTLRRRARQPPTRVLRNGPLSRWLILPRAGDRVRGPNIDTGIAMNNDEPMPPMNLVRGKRVRGKTSVGRCKGDNDAAMDVLFPVHDQQGLVKQGSGSEDDTPKMFLPERQISARQAEMEQRANNFINNDIKRELHSEMPGRLAHQRTSPWANARRLLAEQRDGVCGP